MSTFKPLGHYDLVPVPAVPRATPAPSPALSGPLSDALRLLGPTLDVRLCTALIASTPPVAPSVEHYLRLALAITEALGAMPGVLPLDAPDHRLELVEMYLDETEAVLGELGNPARPATHADVARLSSGLLSTSDLCQALTGIAEGDPLRPRLDGALRRLGAACDAFAGLLEREPGPSTQGASVAAPSAPPQGPGKRRPGRRGRRRSPTASAPRLPAARDGR